MHGFRVLQQNFNRGDITFLTKNLGDVVKKVEKPGSSASAAVGVVFTSAVGASPVLVSRASRSAVASFSVRGRSKRCMERAHRPGSTGPVASNSHRHCCCCCDSDICEGSVTKGRLRGGGGGGRRHRRRCGGGAKSQPPPSFHLIHIAETDVA